MVQKQGGHCFFLHALNEEKGAPDLRELKEKIKKEEKETKEVEERGQFRLAGKGRK